MTSLDFSQTAMITFLSLVGIFDILLGVLYLISSIAIPIARHRMIGSLGVVLYIIQAVIAPFALIFAGIIFFFQGWRLDPILQFAILLLNGLVIYMGIKDILIYRSSSR